MYTYIHTQRHILIQLIFYIVFICRVLICEDGWLMSFSQFPLILQKVKARLDRQIACTSWEMAERG